jgi:hypothetical protein
MIEENPQQAVLRAAQGHNDAVGIQVAKVVQARTAAFCCVVSSVKKSSVARFWLSRAQSSRTPSSNPKFTSCPKMKAAVILRSSKATVLSSTSVLLT